MYGARGTIGSEHRPRVFSVRFLGDDVKHAPRTWRTSPDFSDITEDIPTGASMDHPRFPCYMAIIFLNNLSFPPYLSLKQNIEIV